MKLLITNAGSFRNKGIETLTKSIINGVSNLNEHAIFKVLTYDPEYNSLYMDKNENVSFVKNPFGRLYEFLGLRLNLVISKLGFLKSIKEGFDAFKWADAIISLTADNFSSFYGSKTLLANIAPIKTATAFGKKIFLIGSSFGPFETEKDFKVSVEAIKKASLITVRETISLKFLEKIKIKNARVELTADPAFCLEPYTKNLEKTWLHYNIPSGKTIVGLAASQGIAYYTEYSYAKHLKILQNLVKFLTERLNCHVLLIPHVHHLAVNSDDRVICEQLLRELDFPKNVTLINLEHSAEEIRAIVSKLDLMIAERMHAAIASLSQNVPTFVISYGVKSKGILGDIFGFDTLENYLLPIEKLDEETLEKKVKFLLHERGNVRKYLKKVMPKFKEKSKRNFTLIMEALKQ